MHFTGQMLEFSVKLLTEKVLSAPECCAFRGCESAKVADSGDKTIELRVIEANSAVLSKVDRAKSVTSLPARSLNFNFSLGSFSLKKEKTSVIAHVARYLGCGGRESYTAFMKRATTG